MFILTLLIHISFEADPEDLLSQMTLVEKAAQMTMAERGDLKEGDIRNYALGAALSGGGSVPEENNPQGWVNLLNGFWEESAQTRLKIPIIYGIDCVHGNNNVQNSTIFPHNVGYGATAVGNEALAIKNVEEEGAAVREEIKAIGVPWIFAPLLGNPQDPRWGCSYEAYSENISIPTLLGPAYIRAVQATNEVSTSMKHYLAEGYTINGTQFGDAVLTEEEVREIVAPYAASVKAGAWTLMTAFNTINNLSCTENKFILQTLIKDELHFDGYIFSDWGSVDKLVGGDYRNKVARTINAGVDLIMATANGRQGWIDTIDAIVGNVEDGTIPLARVDDAVLRILRVKKHVGLLDGPAPRKPGELGNHRELARAHVADTLVLLKNTGKIVSRLSAWTNFLVAGQGADDIGMQCGGWTLSWQGAHGATVPGTSILSAFRAIAGKNFTFSENATAPGAYDAAIVVIGEDPYAEDVGDRAGDISLRARDQAALWNAYGLGVPLVVIILSGRPMHLLDETEKWDAAISANLPGSEAGSGIADVLFGEKDFVAKTPNTWRKTLGGDVIYPYGHGLTKNTE